jgi:cell division protein FtsI (penicillin-binding protein 3)
VFTTFMAVLPSDQPQYLLTIIMDEPQGTPETHGSTTAAWNAGPVTGAIIARIAPMLGLKPRFDLPPSERLILAKETR